jgi:uncharacterized membrane protein YphA (DoxX/SURF4 family)
MNTNAPVRRIGGGVGYGLTTLRICLGIFFLFLGVGKLRWLIDSQPLATELAGYLKAATNANRWYVERILPGLPFFARLVPLGELFTGLALIAGFWTRLAAGLALLMVLNFHLAAGTLFHYAFLTNGMGLPLIGSLFALATGGGRLPWSLSK